MRARRADAAAGRHLELARVDALRVAHHLGAGVHSERAVDVRVVAEHHHQQAHRKARAAEDRRRVGMAQRREPRVRQRLRHPDVHVESQRVRDLVLEEPAERPVARIDPPHQLPFVETESEPVVALPRARWPGRPLTRHDGRETIRVRDHAAVDRLVEREQPGLVRQQLAHRDRFLALLRELGPVGADALVVVEPAARVRERQGHRRQPLGGRVHEDHRALLPRGAGRVVADPAPQVHDLFAAMERATRAAELAPAREVLDERVAHPLESRGDGAEDLDVLAVSHLATSNAPQSSATPGIRSP